MPEFCSPGWVQALDDAVRDNPRVAAATTGVRLTIEQVVTGGDGAGDQDVVWHVEVDDGTVRFRSGPAADPTVRFTTDRLTAWAVASGTTTTQAAFMAGDLRVGGDTRALVDHHDLLAGLGEVVAALHTTPPT